MRYLLLIISIVCLVSCKAQKEMKPVGQEMENLVLIEQDNFSGIESFETQVIRDAKSLRKFYTEINKTRKPGLPVPIIDFSKEMVLLVCAGEQSGEKTVHLSKLKDTATELSIAVQMWDKERKGDAAILPMYYPIYLYKLPITDKSIDFQKVDD